MLRKLTNTAWSSCSIASAIEAPLLPESHVYSGVIPRRSRRRANNFNLHVTIIQGTNSSPRLFRCLFNRQGRSPLSVC